MTFLAGKYYYLTLGLLAFCTIVGLAIAFMFQREVNHDLAPTTEKDLLDPLEKAYYSGLMDEAEFRRIQASMQRQKAGEILPIPKRSPQPSPAPPSATEDASSTEARSEAEPEAG